MSGLGEIDVLAVERADRERRQWIAGEAARLADGMAVGAILDPCIVAPLVGALGGNASAINSMGRDGLALYLVLLMLANGVL